MVNERGASKHNGKMMILFNNVNKFLFYEWTKEIIILCIYLDFSIFNGNFVACGTAFEFLHTSNFNACLA